VAARFVENRVKEVKITPYFGKIQDKDEDYYMQFALVICGLDSIEARRWINNTLVEMVDGDNPDSLKPLIDGGTEGKEPFTFRNLLSPKSEIYRF
jgi:ubiquitin-activating enzyme E1 C